MPDFVNVRVKPGSQKGPLIEPDDDGVLTIYVREHAIDGRANEAVVRLLAEHLGVPRGQITLTAGARSRVKRFRIG